MGDAEFRNQTRSSDWVLPPEVVERFNLLDGAVLSEYEWDGVPAPLILSFALEVADKTERFGGAEDISDVVAGIETRIAEEQARYPDSELWGGMRASVVGRLLKAEETELAYDFAWNITNPRMAAINLADVNDETEGALGWKLARQIVQLDDAERRAAMLQALRDRAIETNPLSGHVAGLNQILKAGDIETDHVRGWIESQRPVHPSWDWDVVAETLPVRHFWEDTPMALRQHVMWHYCQIHEEIMRRQIPDNDDNEAWLRSVIFPMNAWEDAFPDAIIFGVLRGLTSGYLLRDYPSLAVRVANSIRDPEVGAGVVGEFIDAGREAEAIEVAAELADPRLVVEVLTSVDWQDEAAPLRRLSEIITSDTHPLQRRIGVLEMVIERLKLTGQTEAVMRFETALSELRQHEGL